MGTTTSSQQPVSSLRNVDRIEDYLYRPVTIQMKDGMTFRGRIEDVTDSEVKIVLLGPLGLSVQDTAETAGKASQVVQTISREKIEEIYPSREPNEWSEEETLRRMKLLATREAGRLERVGGVRGKQIRYI